VNSFVACFALAAIGHAATAPPAFKAIKYARNT
jgi:hypothetical protein